MVSEIQVIDVVVPIRPNYAAEVAAQRDQIHPTGFESTTNDSESGASPPYGTADAQPNSSVSRELR